MRASQTPSESDTVALGDLGDLQYVSLHLYAIDQKVGCLFRDNLGALAHHPDLPLSTRRCRHRVTLLVQDPKRFESTKQSHPRFVIVLAGAQRLELRDLRR